MSLLTAVREDVATVFLKDPAARSTLEVLCCYPGLHAIWLHRVANFLWRHNLRLLGRLVSHVGRWLTGIEIHPGATVGRRVFIDHGMGVVIGETAEVGDDALLYQGVVLGGTSLEKVKRHPTLGKNVVIGSGSIVLGPIQIGANAKVGAGSVVLRSVPAGATVVGVPARLVGQPEPQKTDVDLQHGRIPDPVVKAISEAFERQTRLEERVRALEHRLAEVDRESSFYSLPSAAQGADLEQQVQAALREVIDPEVGVSLVEMGFVAGVSVEAHRVRVELSIPEPSCPYMEHFADQVRRKIRGLNGIEQVDVTFVDAVAGPTIAEAGVGEPEATSD